MRKLLPLIISLSVFTAFLVCVVVSSQHIFSAEQARRERLLDGR